jgi:hypothetical protein
MDEVIINDTATICSKVYFIVSFSILVLMFLGSYIFHPRFRTAGTVVEHIKESIPFILSIRGLTLVLIGPELLSVLCEG